MRIDIYARIFIHYENMATQYTDIFFFFLVVNNLEFHYVLLYFLIFAQNIVCRYTLEPPHRGGSNEYPQSMFWSKNKKKIYKPMHTPNLLYRMWFKRVYITRTCFRDI